MSRESGSSAYGNPDLKPAAERNERNAVPEHRRFPVRFSYRKRSGCLRQCGNFPKLGFLVLHSFRSVGPTGKPASLDVCPRCSASARDAASTW